LEPLPPTTGAWWRPDLGEEAGELLVQVPLNLGQAQNELQSKLTSVLEHIGWDYSTIDEAFWINNETLRLVFEETQKIIAAKQKIFSKIARIDPKDPARRKRKKVNQIFQSLPFKRISDNQVPLSSPFVQQKKEWQERKGYINQPTLRRPLWL